MKGGYEVRIARERAFCPLSQIDIARTSDPAVHEGQTYAFRIIEYKNGGKDVVVSRRKHLEEQQRASAADVRKSIVPGAVLAGRVASVLDFGAFVDLEPGIEGLAHASTFAPTGRHGGWSKSVAAGLTGAFEILSVDTAQKRIGVALIEEGSSRAAGATPSPDALAPGAIVTGKIERHEKFGVFVFLSPGRTGLMPFAETGVDRDMDMLKAFPIGSDVEVVVLEVDPAGRRIRLSKKAVAEQREQAELRKYAASADAAPAASIGSLADKLRGALERE